MTVSANLSLEETAMDYIEKKAGPVLYVEYAKHCQTHKIEPVDYLKFYKLIFQVMGAMK